MVKLTLYAEEQAVAASLIRAFWQCHNGETQTREEGLQNLADWTREGQRFYFIRYQGEPVGFVHLGSRGAECDWLEDLFVLPDYQRQGIGTRAVALAEEIVKEYSVSMYIEAAARNQGAIRLYRKLGYDCLNTITIRKDFQPERYETVAREQIQGQAFQVRKWRG